MLRVVEEAARTDTGRQRTANEDAYIARSPVYAVADGMGGAQAGEVAARMAAEAFESPLPDGTNPEQELGRIAADANRRIFDHARSDASRSGMGTTLTGALLRGDEVSIVHVGDSRAYLLRDGELRQLTRDHSLVEELRRRGQLTSEEAEDHPQRSVITRALGPEAEVEPDIHTHKARSGDVFLLCSDGLTSMVREDRLQEVLTESPTLSAAADSLVEEANRMGGRDNITVIMFRVDGEGRGPAADGSSEDTAEQTATDIDAAAVATAVAAAEPERAPEPYREPPESVPRVDRRRRRRRRLRVALALLVTLLVLTGLAVAAVAGARSVYFIGQNDRGLITLYRGVPYELPAGLELYDTEYVSSVQVRTLRPFERRRLLDHELRSRSDAADQIRDLERGR